MSICDSFTDEIEFEGKDGEEQTYSREGGICPACHEGSLAYDGKLELVCPNCQVVFSAGFT